MDQEIDFSRDTHELIEAYAAEKFNVYIDMFYEILKSKVVNLELADLDLAVIQRFINKIHKFCVDEHLPWDVWVISFIYFEKTLNVLLAGNMDNFVGKVRVIFLGCFIIACKSWVDELDFKLIDFEKILVGTASSDAEHQKVVLSILFLAEDRVWRALQFDISISSRDYYRLVKQFLRHLLGRERSDVVTMGVMLSDRDAFKQQFINAVIKALRDFKFSALDPFLADYFVNKFYAWYPHKIKTCEVLVWAFIYFKNVFGKIIQNPGSCCAIDILHILFGCVMIANEKLGLIACWDEFSRQIFPQEFRYSNLGYIKNIVSYFLGNFVVEQDLFYSEAKSIMCLE